MRTGTFLPRPEYPRPDRQRSFVHGVDWINLNGAWEFRFDAERSGLDHQWQLPSDSRWDDQILVPFCWESLAAWGEAGAAGNDHFVANRAFKRPLELTRFNYRFAERYEVGWYRRRVTIPRNSHWEGKRVILTVGAADFRTDAWCNGHYLGQYEDGYTPFEFDITDALEPDTEGCLSGLIVFRVEDPMDNREQPVGKQWGWYATTSGIWQTVFLEPRAPEFIRRFEITTDLKEKEVRMKVFTQGGTGVDLEITSPTGALSSHRFEVQDSLCEVRVAIDPVILWDPNDPQLYRFKLTLRSGTGADVVHGYFGMRSLSAEPVAESGQPAALVLNGKPIYLRGALYQSYHPEGVYTAGDVQALIDDITCSKRFGFDMLRVHIKIDDPLLLYYADTLGILMMADFPNFGEGGNTPLGRQRFEKMMRAGIERDFNHPSIIAWCLFNETWGFGGQSEFVHLINPGSTLAGPGPTREPGTKLGNLDAYRWVQSMWQLAKTLDPTRLVEDMSVVAWDHLEYYGHGDTDVNSWHFYTNDYRWARQHIEEVVEKTYAGSSFNYVPGFEQGSQPLINSEYGGVGALDGDIDVSWSFKFLTNELRRHGKLSAYIYTELHDVEWERNGFLNYDRTPKEFGYDPTIINHGDVLPINAPPIQRCNPGETLNFEVLSSHFSRTHRENVSLHWHLSGIDEFGWLHDDIARQIKPIPFRHHRVELADQVKLRMPNDTMLCTFWVRAMTADGVLVARNFVQVFVDGGAPTREEHDRRMLLRAEPQGWKRAEWSKGFCSPDEAKAAGRCHGNGHGFFEWEFPVDVEMLAKCTRIRVLCEASAHREGTPQTDTFAHPSSFEMQLNGLPVHKSVLPNHPHDARGALSYLRNARGAYGYLSHGTSEGLALRELIARTDGGPLRLRCLVPADAPMQGGLTIYGYDCGAFPVPPTLVLEFGRNGSVRSDRSD